MIGLGIFFQRPSKKPVRVAAAGFAIGLNSLAGAATAGLTWLCDGSFWTKVAHPNFGSYVLLALILITQHNGDKSNRF
jgi:hypothetical protein